MPLVYTAYALDVTGRIMGPPIRIIAQDDLEALELADRLGEDRDLELWHGSRMVGPVSRSTPSPR